MADPSFWHPLLTVWVDQVDQHWRHMRIPTRERLGLRHDLVADLGAARLAGATIDALTERSPDQFAEDVASSLDIRATQAGRKGSLVETGPSATLTEPACAARSFKFRLVGSAILGALAGGIAALVTIYPMGLRLADAAPDHEGPLILGTHVAAALLAASCGSIAVSFMFAADPRRGQLAKISGVALLVLGAVAVVPAVTLAWSTGFDSSPGTASSEVLLVLAVLIAGMWALASRLTPAATTFGASTQTN